MPIDSAALLSSGDPAELASLRASQSRRGVEDGVVARACEAVAVRTGLRVALDAVNARKRECGKAYGAALGAEAKSAATAASRAASTEAKALRARLEVATADAAARIDAIGNRVHPDAPEASAFRVRAALARHVASKPIDEPTFATCAAFVALGRKGRGEGAWSGDAATLERALESVALLTLLRCIPGCEVVRGWDDDGARDDLSALAAGRWIQARDLPLAYARVRNAAAVTPARAAAAKGAQRAAEKGSEALSYRVGQAGKQRRRVKVNHTFLEKTLELCVTDFSNNFIIVSSRRKRFSARWAARRARDARCGASKRCASAPQRRRRQLSTPRCRQQQTFSQYVSSLQNE